MRKLWLGLALLPCLFFGGAIEWQAKSEEEALFLRRIADFWSEGEYLVAKGQMEEFLKTYPESEFSDTLCAALGDLLLREKSYSSALHYYLKISNNDLKSKVFLNQMQCLYHMEWYSTLADECEARLKREELQGGQKIHTTYYLAVALYQQCLNSTHDPEALRKLALRAKPYFETQFNSELNSEIAQAFAHLSCILKDYPRAAAIYAGLARRNGTLDEEMLFEAAVIQAEYDKELSAKTFAEIAQNGGEKAKEAAYNQLVLSFDAGQYGKIIDEKEALLAQIPPSRIPMARLFLGRSLVALKMYLEACVEIKAYLSAAEPGDTFKAALVSLADASFQVSDIVSLDYALSKLESVYPSDPELPRGRFTRAIMLKQAQKPEEARKELSQILIKYPEAPQAPQALFELSHLDYQEKNWTSCRARSIAFLSQFPEHGLAPYAWRYLISSSAELAALYPDQKETKEQLAFDLEKLLRQKKLLSVSEQSDWEFLLAKTNFELDCFEEALSVLQKLADSKSPFPQEANARLLLALCYRDGLGDLDRFCQLAEEAIEMRTDLMDKGSLHSALFNAYLERAKSDPLLFEKGAEHLYAAFEAKNNVQTENLLWLADLYFTRIQTNEEEGVSPSEQLLRRTSALLERIILKHQDSPEGILFLEPVICKLGKLYLAIGKKDDAVSLIENLMKEYQASPLLDWKCGQETQFLLAEAYAQTGKEQEAIALYESISKEKSSLRDAIGAAACLHGARVRIAKWVKEKISPEDPQFIQVLGQLKDLVLQKNLANEPLHLEAALEYIDLQDGGGLEKRLFLLKKAKMDFEGKEDLLSKDYHEARARFPRKDQIFQAYIRFMEAEILTAEGALAQTLDTQKQLQAKAKGILLSIIDEKAHPALVARARKRLLENGFVAEQKT